MLLIINCLSTHQFFFKKIKLVLIDIIIILITTILFMKKYNECDILTTYIVSSYLLWIIFATYLNYYIYSNFSITNFTLFRFLANNVSGSNNCIFLFQFLSYFLS